MDQYQAIIIALIMAIPPLVAQLVAAIRNLQDASAERRKEDTEQRRAHVEALRAAAEQWEKLYKDSQEEIARLENANKAMLAEIRQENENLRTEKEALEKRVSALEAENERLRRRKTKVSSDD